MFVFFSSRVKREGSWMIIRTRLCSEGGHLGFVRALIMFFLGQGSGEMG